MQEMKHEPAEIHAEAAQDTFSAHADDDLDDREDDDHASQHSTLLNSISVPAIMPGEIQNKYLQVQPPFLTYYYVFLQIIHSFHYAQHRTLNRLPGVVHSTASMYWISRTELSG